MISESSSQVMAPTGVAVLCYWNGRVDESRNKVAYKGSNVKVMPMKLNYGISYSGLLDKIYAITGIDKHKFELNIICTYPISTTEYRGIPMSSDETLQLILEGPSRSSAAYCVEMFLETKALVGPKWEDLGTDCLVNVFQKVGLESLLLSVPLVCKSWYKASLDPNCWKILIFRKDMISNDILWGYARVFHERQDCQIQISTVSAALMKFVIDRSHGCATTLELPIFYNEKAKEALEYAADKCPSLKSLALFFPLRSYDSPGTINPRLISKLKNLEMLTIENIKNMRDVLYEISIHCSNLIKLSAPCLHFLEDEASIIASLPKIKYLVLRKANFVRRENVLIILDGCRDLIHFDVRYCIGFDEDDIEILSFASYIPEFVFEGSTCGENGSQDFNVNAYDSNSDYSE